jgi:hypothetical protein
MSYPELIEFAFSEARAEFPTDPEKAFAYAEWICRNPEADMWAGLDFLAELKARP